MITAQEKPKPEKSLLTQSQTEYRIRHGRGKPETITHKELIRLTTTSRIRRIRSIRSIPNNQTTKQRNNVTTQTLNQHNTTHTCLKPNISKTEHIHKQTYPPQNSGGDTTFCVGDLLCGLGGCVVKWCVHRYSCVSYIVTVCIRGVAQSCRYIVAHSVVCSHTVKHLTTRQSHRQAQLPSDIIRHLMTRVTYHQLGQIKTLPHSLEDHPKSSHKKGWCPSLTVSCVGVNLGLV